MRNAETIAEDIRIISPSRGSTLDSRTREFMESRFGYDFSEVRVHTDARAAESARAMNSLAYTVGQDIVFGDGQYNSSTEEGRRLLAHELTHVVQGNLNHITHHSQDPMDETRNTENNHGFNSQSVKPAIRRSYDFHRIIARSVSPNYSTIEDNLSYGLFDWAITDEEAHEILTILAGLSEGDVADTVAKMEQEGLVQRLIENISDADKIAFASLIESIHKKRSTSSIAAHIEDLMSYGLLDWVITDAEARLALETLKNLRSDPGRLRAVIIAIPSDQYERFYDNLSTEDRSDNLRFLQEIEMIRGHGMERQQVPRETKTQKVNLEALTEPELHKKYDLISGALSKFTHPADETNTLKEEAGRIGAELTKRALAAGRTFSPEATERMKAFFIANATSASPMSCIATLNAGMRNVINNPAQPVRSEIQTTMAEFQSSGIAGESRIIEFRDAGNKITKGVREPVTLEKSIWEAVIEMTGGDFGWSVFGLSIMDGYHSVTLTLDNSDPLNPRIYWSDQWSTKGGWKEYSKGALDKEITDLTISWWKSKPDGRKPKTRVTLWRIQRPKPK